MASFYMTVVTRPPFCLGFRFVAQRRSGRGSICTGETAICRLHTAKEPLSFLNDSLCFRKLLKLSPDGL